MSTGTWWVVVPTVDQNASTSYKQQVDFRVQYPAGSAGDMAMQARKPYNDPTYGWIVYWKGPFPTETQAQAAQNPTGSPENPVSGAIKATGNNPSGTTALSGLSAIGDFFGRLDEANLWIRVGEVVLGLILIAVGVARLTNAVPAATKLATTVGATGLAV